MFQNNSTLSFLTLFVSVHVWNVRETHFFVKLISIKGFCCCVSVQSSHLALIDTLMMAYTVEMVSVERVMSCINKYSSAEPLHSDGLVQGLPYDTEDAITTWINKVCPGAMWAKLSKTAHIPFFDFYLMRRCLYLSGFSRYESIFVIFVLESWNVE